jgi:hypothetical protein
VTLPEHSGLKKKALKTGTAALRSFAKVMAVFFAVLTGLSAYKNGGLVTGGVVTGSIATAFAAAGLLAPSLLKPLFIVWMKFGEVMNFVMTRVVLGLVYFVAITPMAIVRRALGYDPLKMKLDRTAATYWQKREGPGGPDHFNRAF